MYCADCSNVSAFVTTSEIFTNFLYQYSSRIIQKLFLSVIIEKSPFKAVYLSVIGVILLVLLLVVLYLIWKIKKEKQFKKELAAAGLLNFNEGVTGSINPDLGIDEQAELLPYNKEFEFPPEKLKLGLLWYAIRFLKPRSFQ